MAVTSNQISPGTTLSLDGKIYRVETSVKVTVAKGVPFIKTKLKNLMSDEVIEKNFKLDQEINEVNLSERRLEFLYLEGKDYLFLDIDELDEVLVATDVDGDKVNYLKEGIQIRAMFYGETIFSIELPQFLELMIIKIEDIKEYEIEFDLNKKMKEVVEFKTNEQLNQFSKIYFNKIKKDLIFDDL